MRGLHLLQGKHKLALLSHKKMATQVKKGRGSIGAYIPREEIGGEGIKKHNRLKPLKFKI